MSWQPRFTLAQLQYFVAAAETGSITVAAQRLHASQSAMSSAIQRLERELGCDLFIRHHARGITLTPSGRHLADKARVLLRQAAEFEEASHELQQGMSGELHAGFFVTLAPFYVPRVLPRLRTEHPDLTVHVVEADGIGLHEALRTGACEIAFTYGIDVGDDMSFQAVAHLRPYALVSAQHPVVGRSTASLRELARTPMVMLDLPETSHSMLGMLHRADVTPPEIVRTTSFETMRGLVAAGGGFTILTQRPHLPAAHEGQVHEVAIADVEPVAIGTLRIAGLRPNQRTRAFTEECRAAAAALTGGG